MTKFSAFSRRRSHFETPVRSPVAHFTRSSNKCWAIARHLCKETGRIDCTERHNTNNGAHIEQIARLIDCLQSFKRKPNSLRAARAHLQHALYSLSWCQFTHLSTEAQAKLVEQSAHQRDRIEELLYFAKQQDKRCYESTLFESNLQEPCCFFFQKS